MSSAEEESDTNTTENVEEEEDETMFQCRHKGCEGQQFTAAEKDVHRQWHREESASTRRSRGNKRDRVPNPAGSVATSMFIKAPVEKVAKKTKERKKPSKKRRKAPARKAAKKKLIETTHHYDKTVRSEKNPGA